MRFYSQKGNRIYLYFKYPLHRCSDLFYSWTNNIRPSRRASRQFRPHMQQSLWYFAILVACNVYEAYEFRAGSSWIVGRS